MILHTKEYRFDENKFYEATITDVEERIGNFGEYYIFRFDTPFGKSSYLASGRKLINIMENIGIKVTGEMEISTEDVVGRKIQVSLGISDRGFVEVKGVNNKLNTLEVE